MSRDTTTRKSRCSLTAGPVVSAQRIRYAYGGRHVGIVCGNVPQKPEGLGSIPGASIQRITEESSRPWPRLYRTQATSSPKGDAEEGVKRLCVLAPYRKRNTDPFLCFNAQGKLSLFHQEKLY